MKKIRNLIFVLLIFNFNCTEKQIKSDVKPEAHSILGTFVSFKNNTELIISKIDSIGNFTGEILKDLDGKVNQYKIQGRLDLLSSKIEILENHKIKKSGKYNGSYIPDSSLIRLDYKMYVENELEEITFQRVSYDFHSQMKSDKTQLSNKKTMIKKNDNTMSYKTSIKIKRNEIIGKWYNGNDHYEFSGDGTGCKFEKYYSDFVIRFNKKVAQSECECLIKFDWVISNNTVKATNTSQSCSCTGIIEKNSQRDFSKEHSLQYEKYKLKVEVVNENIIIIEGSRYKKSHLGACEIGDPSNMIFG